MSAMGLALAPDAAMVLGIASTAMPFARTREEEAERWLRLLRLHGEVGIALQALGVSEVPLPRESQQVEADPVRPDAVVAVTEHTVRIAGERGVNGVGTTEVLLAVMEVYEADFDRVLDAHGTDREEVLERLESHMVAPPRG
jgi:hypothetical protein